jgi:hypothetical protein
VPSAGRITIPKSTGAFSSISAANSMAPGPSPPYPYGAASTSMFPPISGTTIDWSNRQLEQQLIRGQQQDLSGWSKERSGQQARSGSFADVHHRTPSTGTPDKPFESFDFGDFCMVSASSQKASTAHGQRLETDSSRHSMAYRRRDSARSSPAREENIKDPEGEISTSSRAPSS